MTKEIVRRHIIAMGIIPAIRTSSATDARFAAEIVADAGIPIVEITMTEPGALDVITELADGMPDLVVGAGTIFDMNTARRCVNAGARFLTSPGLDVHIVEFARKEEILAMPGAFTPTEVTAAWQAGADFIKVFPCAQLGGASYIHALRAPFPDVLFVAAGGVSLQTAAEFITAGAAAIGVGTELIPKKALRQRDKRWISQRARRFLHVIQEARAFGPHTTKASIDGDIESNGAGTGHGLDLGASGTAPPRRAVDLEITLSNGATPRVIVRENEGAVVKLPDGTKFGFVPTMQIREDVAVVVGIWDVNRIPCDKRGSVAVDVGGPVVHSDTSPSFGIRILRVITSPR